MSKKFALLLIACLLAVPIAGVVGSYLVQSNRTDITAEYLLTLASSLTGGSITSTAVLTKNGVVVPNAIINFYFCSLDKSKSGGNSTARGTALTNGSGVASFVDSITANGVYHYVAEWTMEPAPPQI